MAKRYDGSINIDTKIDEKGFNRGIRDMEGKMRGVGDSLTKGLKLEGFARKAKSIGRVLKSVFSSVSQIIAIGLIIGVGMVLSLIEAIVTFIGAAIGVTIALSAAFMKFTNVMYEGLAESNYLYNNFRAMNSLFLDLKSSILAAFTPLWLAVEPTVTRIINWLIQMLNILSQVMAVLFGQSTYMKYVAGSAQAAQKATGGVKKNIEDTKKAAEGALAAFDEINVLRQDQEPPPAPPAGGGGAGVGTLGEFEETPVDENIKTKVEEIKDKIALAWQEIKRRARNAWADITEFFTTTWEKLKEIWGNVSTWWTENVSDPVKNSMRNAWEETKSGFATAWETIVGAWNGFKAWWKQNVTDPFINNWDQTWAQIKVKAYLAWLNVKAKWIRAKTWFQEKVLDPIKDSFSKTWDKVKEAFGKSWDAMGEIVKGVINRIIGFLNNLMSKAAGAFNSLIEAMNTIGNVIPGWVNISPVSVPQIPKLAQGAVIPPNAAFMAVLGDQKHGTNIEAPEDLIRQIVREETADQAVTINFAGNLSGLVQVLKPYIDKENTRVGGSLVKGAIT